MSTPGDVPESRDELFDIDIGLRGVVTGTSDYCFDHDRWV
jgi:hypothetical protein